MRWMSVRELAHSMGLPSDSPLTTTLVTLTTVTTVQAGRCLGRSVHAGVARRIIATLLNEGSLAPGLTYGSAYSGVDTFAAAVEIETGGRWEYTYASERVPYVRRVLLGAWGIRGLREECCYYDAAGEEAIAAPRVDLEVYTGECGPYSDSNRDQDAADQLTSLAHLCRSFDHARRRAPAVIVVENVNKPSVVGPVTATLLGFTGYRMRHGPLSAMLVGGSHARRDRYYWVLTKLNA